jgi:hypothetical protein
MSPPGPAKRLTQELQVKDDFCVNLGAPCVRRHPDGSGTGCRGRTRMLKSRDSSKGQAAKYLFLVLMLNRQHDRYLTNFKEIRYLIRPQRVLTISVLISAQIFAVILRNTANFG